MEDLFEHGERKRGGGAPLADRMRPRRLDEVVGQAHLLGPDKLLHEAIRDDRVPSMVLWGPPGTGKTTLARVIAAETRADFVTLSAVLSGVADLRSTVKAAAERKKLYSRRTILFVDEIHRFNKSQQDALLPHVENGTVILIGATTENPSFAINAALLSRARVFELQPLAAADLAQLLARALGDGERGLAALGLSLPEAGAEAIAARADGDARRALDVLEVAARACQARGASEISLEAIAEAQPGTTLLHDRSGEAHYNVVSAFIKSMRGSDPDAALYWMFRLLEAGEDPLFVLRRLLIFASEDVGNADPRALQLAVAADQTFQRLGLPEGLHALSQCCTYLACAPKSNASYKAFKSARDDVRAHGALPVPRKLRNAVTRQMREWGYGEGYRYPHDEGGYAAGETYLPEELVAKRYYEPTDSGLESQIKKRLQELRARRGGDQ